ncbi:hypothetical protein TW85_20245 [Marinomonas sp. S3726]|uniref:hypothetical protein n=1 Tax=Marinomonas sp. S3726 TaxID=579484 RepID=UPI0005FA906D|nr:hypothetical protein [Marinomonas sp. S3726]KJZ10316.1 hypothetical protein TW85_20245 [Marinomonas sp. S3726]
MLERKIYEQALKNWGATTQAVMAMGEMGELIAELNRCFIQGRDNTNEILGEIADVEIMIGQLRCIFGDEGIDTAKKNKLDRLERILAGSEDHPHGQCK